MNKKNYIVENCAVVVLAAGMSSRLGSPKQLLEFKGKNLLQHSVETALQTSIRPIFVIVGANADIIKKQIEGMEIVIVDNLDWQQGIASSLCSGVAAIEKIKTDIDGIIFMVCDQPFITKLQLENLVKAQNETGLPIVASNYNNDLGTPALFHKSFFSELLKLKGDNGAKKLINQFKDHVATVPFPKGDIDIDTMKDFNTFISTIN